jgi:hypothetical protein
VKRPHLEFESSFIEDATFLSIRCEEVDGDLRIARDFHREMNGIYGLRSQEKREASFKQCYDQWFSRLGLRLFFENILSEFPLLCHASLSVMVRRVWSSKGEGAELYVQNGLQTILLRLQVERFQEKAYLESFLRFELMHISDMLDPGFEYTPTPELDGRSELEKNLMRDRFRILWDLYVSYRLKKRGFKPIISLEKQRRLFEKAFSGWNSEVQEDIFHRVTRPSSCSQGDLLQFARDHRLGTTLGEGGLVCPLCNFPNYDRVNHQLLEDLGVLQEIQNDYPEWGPSKGLCQQCFEIYRVKMKDVVRL